MFRWNLRSIRLNGKAPGRSSPMAAMLTCESIRTQTSSSFTVYWTSVTRPLPSRTDCILVPGPFNLCFRPDRTFDRVLNASQPGVGTYFNPPGVVGPLFTWLTKIADEAIVWYTIPTSNPAHKLRLARRLADQVP